MMKLIQPLMRRLAFALALSHAMLASATTELSDLPLVINVTAPPNVLMILDDSGSMESETLPDAFYSSFSIDYPLRFSLSLTFTPDYDDANILNLAARASTINRLYYDPTVTYRPWRKADGTTYDEASPTAAPMAPDSTTTVDLTAQQNATLRWSRNTVATTFSFAINSNSACGASFSCSKSFWPMTFFVYKGSGALSARNSYYRYRISGNNAERLDLETGQTESLSAFTWSNGITRTIAEEKQNFANWFTYARSRINAAKGGVSYAFSTLGKNYRVGFRKINSTSGWLDIPTSGSFSETNRTNFFDRLFATTVSGGTPLRVALANAGEYFSTSAPWGPDVGGSPLACRQSYAILTTDGYYNDTLDGVKGVNSSVGTGDNQLALPYKDAEQSFTLGDIAAYYYTRDLRSDIPDKVPRTAGDAGEGSYMHQHMSTFAVAFGLQGSLDPESDLPALTAGTKTWPSVSNDTGKLDDLWHATVNGRGRFVSASSPQEFADGLKGALDAIVARTASAANLGISANQLTAGGRLFQARFTSETWTGDVWSYTVTSENTIPDTPTWKASEQLPAPASRRLFTHNGTSPVEFEWDQLSDTQKAALSGNSEVIDYLRGDASGEVTNGGSFRNRTSDGHIGDIVHSSPIFVTSPANLGYDRYAWEGASSYQEYRANKANRAATVFVAANDGFLHAFDASTGAERYGFAPSGAIAGMYQLTRPNYDHRFINDGQLVVSEVFDNVRSTGAWRSVLVGSSGRGGRQLYALDVSNAALADDNPASQLFMWQFSDNDFGYFTGAPQIRRMNNGAWAVLVGNGYNSADYKGVLFIVNAVSGELISKIDTGGCAATDDPCVSNGLAEVSTWDDNDDGNVDYIYAGDLRGNVWRFDVTSDNPSNWRVSFGTSQNPLPLFRARDSNGTPQPITSAISLMLDPDTNTRWISFGTGRFLGESDRSNTSVQTWYGLYDNYTGAAGSATPVTGRSDLAQRIVLSESTQTVGQGDAAVSTTVRVLSAPGDPSGGQAVTDADGAYIRKGWYLDLLAPNSTGSGERMLFGVNLSGGALFTTSSIPAQDPCEPGGSGWLMGINPYTGGRLDADLFADRAKVTLTVGEQQKQIYVSGVRIASMPSQPILLRNDGSGSGGQSGSGSSNGNNTGGDTGDTGSTVGGGSYKPGQGTALVGTSDLQKLLERLNLPGRYGRISWRELISE
ncbi:pilus assembly protein [Methyloversatilis thermotolerans]|uniref:pilus assembly protein n=1 Tax=Methyloversatilis thermotolerans TaxID=1346290 RepID=UPI00037712E4|nr:PilC/PilY family type IV pilus protein [Methyloversatilis thermotolerans]